MSFRRFLMRSITKPLSQARAYSTMKLGEAPLRKIRWFYATDIPTIKPVDRSYKQKQRAKKFLPFEKSDSERIEIAFQNYKKTNDIHYSIIPVNEDQLFDCDIRRRLLKPAYWIGPEYEIRRGTWFLDNSPVPEAIAEQLERAYEEVKPYKRKDLSSVQSGDELSSRYTPDCHIESELTWEKGQKWLFEDLPGIIAKDKDAVFIDEKTAVLLDDSIGLRKFIVDTFAKTKAGSLMGGYRVVRGYEEKDDRKKQEENEKRDASTENEHSEPKDKSADTSEAFSSKSTAKEIMENIKNRVDWEFSNEKYQKEMEGDFTNNPSRTENSGDREVDHLIFCIHGVGQNMSMSNANVNFAHDCSVFRQQLKGLFKKYPERYAKEAYPKGTDLKSEEARNCKVQVLPIVWRYNVDFSWEHVYKECAQDGSLRYPKLLDLNINGTNPIRTMAADVVLDILLYYEPGFKRQIISNVVKSMNTLYDKYLERHPNFKGKVSICGHSLGSVIGMDLLCLQPDTVPTGDQFDPEIHLKFPVENYFGMGSPNGVFKLMKRQNICSRSTFWEKKREKNVNGMLLDTEISPKVNNVYNIFYPMDIVAYRIEPLVHTCMSEYKPQAIPFADENNFNTKIESLSTLPVGILDNPIVKSVFKMTGMEAQYKKACKAADFSLAQAPKELDIPEKIKVELQQLNKNGRLDYSLPQGYFEIDVINALGSHTQYLKDENVASFILKELWNKGSSKVMGVRQNEQGLQKTEETDKK